MIRIVLRHELPEAFVKKWGDRITSEMTAGWVTWVDDCYVEALRDVHAIIHPEHNKYEIDFPSAFFEVPSEFDIENVLKL
jgi:hypothetical protein